MKDEDTAKYTVNFHSGSADSVYLARAFWRMNSRVISARPGTKPHSGRCITLRPASPCGRACSCRASETPRRYTRGDRRLRAHAVAPPRLATDRLL